MDTRELYNTINLMCADYANYVKGYSTEEGIKSFNKIIHLFPDDGKSRFTGYSLMNTFLRSKGRSPDMAGIFYQAFHWDKTKVFYRFNEELENEIKHSDISKTMVVPSILLNQCPFSSFFIQTRGGIIDWNLEEKLHRDKTNSIKGDGVGFFCTISDGMEYSSESKKLVKTGNKILDIAACSENKDGNISFISVSMRIPHSNGAEKIEESIVYAYDYDLAYSEDNAEDCRNYDMKVLLTALQYILHLCSENSNIVPAQVQKAKSWASKKQKSLSKTKIYDVSIREFPNRSHAKSVGGNTNTGITKSPHIRRAHWAYRWVGSKENKHLELRWVREAYIHKELGNPGAIVNVRNTKEGS